MVLVWTPWSELERESLVLCYVLQFLVQLERALLEVFGVEHLMFDNVL